MVQEWVRMGPRWGQHGSKMGPRWVQDGSRLVNDGPRLVTGGAWLKVSTTRSDEDSTHPKPTLSFLIVSFHPFWPEVNKLALNREYRKEHVWPKTAETAVPAVSKGSRF